MTAIIIYGNPVDGFAYFGPFIDGVEAGEKATEADLPADWWVAELHTAEEMTE